MYIATIFHRYGAVMSLMLWLVLSGNQQSLAQAEPPKAGNGTNAGLTRRQLAEGCAGHTISMPTLRWKAKPIFTLKCIALPSSWTVRRSLDSSGEKQAGGGKGRASLEKSGRGFIHFEEKFDPRVLFVLPQPIPQNPHFALDFGAVVEAYPSRRMIVRFDLGDTLICFRYRGVPLVGESRFTQHNLQFNVGFGVRFF